MRRFGMALLLAVAAALVCTMSWAGDPKADEEAIRASIASYVSAYNRGDAQAVADHWSDSGQWLSPSGEKFTGKKEIAGALKNLFAANKGVTIAVKDADIRLVSDDAAMEEGTVTVSGPNEAPSDSTYIAIHVKKNGKWQLDSVRETAVPDAPAASGPLQELAWLVGDWVDADPEAGSEAHVNWTKNKTFLSYSFKMVSPDGDDLEGTQVIGWDPAEGTIRSWMFDSDGGFGGGIWTQRDNTWIVKFAQTMPDGGSAEATNIYTLVDGNTFTWKSVGRKVNGETLPNIEAVTIVRKGQAVAMKEAKAEKSEKAPAVPKELKEKKPESSAKQPEKKPAEKKPEPKPVKN